MKEFFQLNIVYFKWIGISLAIFVILVLSFGTTSVILTARYTNLIYPGTHIDGIPVGGLTKTQAANLLDKQFNQIYATGFAFNFLDNTRQIDNPNNEIFSLNRDSLVAAAYDAGRYGNWFRRHLKILAYPIIKKEIKLDYTFNKNILKDRLTAAFSPNEKSVKNSEILLTIIDAKKKAYTLDFSESYAGETFNYNESIDRLEQSLQKLQNPAIKLQKRTEQPTITRENALSQRDQIIELLALDNIEFKFEDKTWPITWEDFTHWLQLGLNDEEKVAVIFNKEMVEGRLEAIGQEVNQPAQDAKLQITNGKVTEFKPSKNGQILDTEQTFESTVKQIIENKQPTVTLIVSLTEPKITTESINDLGIKEKIATGVSNFAGSPANRRHNIGVGSATLNGLLIKPGEEFKLMPALGAISAGAGYLPELVIKENKTIPEYGGGLCQVGTTLFRVALAAGLPITARAPHAYRVVYYEPAGTDATIYDPWPDVRFINDTGKHILIQTRMEGNILTFEFWGTKDGRQVTFEGNNKTDDLAQLKPKIFNITSPGPAKMIETEELAPGKKKQTETAHNGADATFYRYLTSATGEQKKETWNSHYKPWQAVILIGVEKKTDGTVIPDINAPAPSVPPVTPIP